MGMFSLFSKMMIFQQLLIKSNFLNVVKILDCLFVHTNVINVFVRGCCSILYPNIIVNQIKFIHRFLAEIPSYWARFHLGLFYYRFLYFLTIFSLLVL